MTVPAVGPFAPVLHLLRELRAALRTREWPTSEAALARHARWRAVLPQLAEDPGAATPDIAILIGTGVPPLPSAEADADGLSMRRLVALAGELLVAPPAPLAPLSAPVPPLAAWVRDLPSAVLLSPMPIAPRRPGRVARACYALAHAPPRTIGLVMCLSALVTFWVTYMPMKARSHDDTDDGPIILASFASCGVAIAMLVCVAVQAWCAPCGHQ
jgi:hypothetical protein